MKTISKYILTTMTVLVATINAWGATYYARAIAYSSPENCGYVWVTINNSSFNESQFSQKVMDSSDNDKYVVAWENHATFTAKYYAKPIDGYKFIGWYDENGAEKSTSTNSNCYHAFDFDATSKEQIKERQGVLLQNENGKLMISKDTIENIVSGVAQNYNDAQEVATSVEIDKDNHVKVFANLVVANDSNIKNLSAKLQNEIKEKVTRTGKYE